MGKRWKTIVSFAVLGFAITAGFYVLGVYKDYTKPFGLQDLALVLANIILCPPLLLFAWCIDCEYGTPAGLEVNLVIVGLLKCGALCSNRAGSRSAEKERVVPGKSGYRTGCSHTPLLYRKNGMTNSLKQTQVANATKNPNTQKSVIVEALYGLLGNSCGAGFNAPFRASSNSSWSSSTLMRL
jgi:hypothetical protein